MSTRRVAGLWGMDERLVEIKKELRDIRNLIS